MNPRNSPSHVLSKKENRTVKNTLGQDRISISTTFVQLYITSPSEQEWLLLGTGALCITHDFQLNTFILVFMEDNRIVWECELKSCSEYLCVSEKFHLLRVDQLMGVSFLCQLEAGHFQNKMIQTLKYISVTHLPTNSMKKSSKISNSKSNQETPQKHTRPQSPIARSRHCIKKCYKKLVITKVGSLKETKSSSCFSSSSSPTFPSEEKEDIYQTLSNIRELQTRYCPCNA
eukprot:TRINITY_DN9150_c0_g1_i1.p1 TRINITY_DN9150_c0_g1~~TRINITY_DN9150_c0_g1_i1.p1  ORF type:complete len:231 (+),score=35.37 TRINITY_DN9150_c0_g1_i1:2-694(+)